MVWETPIEGKTVNLRAMEVEDAAFTFRIRQDRKRTKYIHAVYGTVEEQREWIEKQRAAEDNYMFLVEDKEHKPIGMIGYYDIANDIGELGRALINGTHLQNCEASMLARAFVFETLGAREFKGTVIEANKAIIGSLKQWGGRLVACYYDPTMGCDILDFRVSREDYFARKDKLNSVVYKAIERGLNV